MSRHVAVIRHSVTRGKIFALLSGGVILGLGATATLASWNDEEWVNGGISGTTSGVSTSSFNVEQNRGTGWGDFATSPGGNLTFTAPTSGLTPGDAAYTQVSLRTSSGSVAGELELSAGTSAPTPAFAATSIPLWDALELRVVVTTGAAGTCDAGAFTSTADYVVGDFAAGVGMDQPGSLTRSLDAGSANQQNYCFQLLLPSGSSPSLMGLGVSPMWEFVATSV